MVFKLLIMHQIYIKKPHREDVVKKSDGSIDF